MADAKPKIWLSSPHMGGNEMKYIQEAFDTNWIAPLGPNVTAFERSLADFCDTRHCAALSSGTSAIHLALIMLGVGPGDYVICQSFTFSASANPIRYLGATPVFIDSEPDTWNMDPDLLENAIISIKRNEPATGSSRIRAIIPVHLYGMPAKMDEILTIATRYSIPVIEDAAEALGSRYSYRPAGSMGLMGILSFNGNKIITTSGGGALLSDDQDLVDEARFLSTQARDNAPHYQHSRLGYNYRMSNVLAGIGLGQMEVLIDRVERRREINRIYRENLADIPGLKFQTEPSASVVSNFWLTAVTIDPSLTGGVTRENVRLAMADENIETRPLWKPMHLQPVFESMPSFTNGISEDLFLKGLCLPSGSNLTEKELDRIISTLRKSFTKGKSKLFAHKNKAA